MSEDEYVEAVEALMIAQGCKRHENEYGEGFCCIHGMRIEWRDNGVGAIKGDWMWGEDLCPIAEEEVELPNE